MLRGSFVNMRFTWAALLTAAFIVYGSLYPFHFYHGGATDPFAALLASYDIRQQPLSGLLANIMLYLPLGVFVVLAIDRSQRGALRVLLAVVFGTGLCTLIELTQFYDYGRVTTLTDVYPNASGTLIGALAGLFAPTRWTRHNMRRARPVPLLLLAAFAIAELYPLAPSLNTAWYWDAIASIWQHPHLSLYNVYRHALMWLVVAVALAQCFATSRNRIVLPVVMVGVLFGKILVIDNWLSAADITGAAVAAIAWLGLSGLSLQRQAAVLSGGLILLGLIDSLHPLQWTAAGHPIHWNPFSHMLHRAIPDGARVLSGKFFLYGSLIWTLSLTGVPRVVAGVMVAAGLLFVRLLQTHLVGPSPDTAGAVFALLITALFALVSLYGKAEI